MEKSKINATRREVIRLVTVGIDTLQDDSTIRIEIKKSITEPSTFDIVYVEDTKNTKTKVDYKGIVSEVASILGLQKVAWGQAIKTCKQCVENGFTKDDIIAAAKNMKAGDRRYYSIYSLFIKTDYWLNKTEQSDDKGKLSW